MAHGAHPLGGMAVELVRQHRFDDWQHILDEGWAARHPLVVRAPAVRVWAVEATAGKPRGQPTKQSLMTSMHPKRYLRVLAVATEVPLADEDASDYAAVEVRQSRRRSLIDAGCYTACG